MGQLFMTAPHLASSVSPVLLHVYGTLSYLPTDRPAAPANRNRYIWATHHFGVRESPVQIQKVRMPPGRSLRSQRISPSSAPTDSTADPFGPRVALAGRLTSSISTQLTRAQPINYTVILSRLMDNTSQNQLRSGFRRHGFRRAPLLSTLIL